MSCPNCGRQLRHAGDLEGHAPYCLLTVLAGFLLDRGHELGGRYLDSVDADALWERFGGPATDWLEVELGLDQAARHGDSVEEHAVRILREAGLDAHLHHSGGGIMVAEVRTKDVLGRHVWVTDSEGDEAGPFLVGAYPDSEGEPWFEALSGACTDAELVDRVRRGLTEPG